MHGVPRQTRDVNLVVGLTDESVIRLTRRLASEFFVQEQAAREAVRAGTSFNAVHLASGLKIDFFVRGNAPFDDAEFERGRAHVIQADPERSVVVKSPEDTILRKLQWYRAGGEVSDRQWSDVAGIIAATAESLDVDYLRKWASALGISDLLDRALNRE